jgi:hypothetical protein
MKNHLFGLLALSVCLVLNSQTSILHAQGTAFTYQGRLNDGANPASGTYDLFLDCSMRPPTERSREMPRSIALAWS